MQAYANANPPAASRTLVLVHGLGLNIGALDVVYWCLGLENVL